MFWISLKGSDINRNTKKTCGKKQKIQRLGNTDKTTRERARAPKHTHTYKNHKYSIISRVTCLYAFITGS